MLCIKTVMNRDEIFLIGFNLDFNLHAPLLPTNVIHLRAQMTFSVTSGLIYLENVEAVHKGTCLSAYSKLETTSCKSKLSHAAQKWT